MKISDYFLEYYEISAVNKLKNILDSNLIFEDEFYENFNILETQEYESIDFDLTNIKWLELENINNYKIFGTFNKKNIKQGRLPNYNLICSLNLWIEKPILIKRLFEIKQINKNNVFALWLYVDQEWRLVILDNYFPIDLETNDFAFSCSKENELYIPWIEKGLAKLKNGYTPLCENSIFITINELTGSLPDIIDFNLENNMESVYHELKNKKSNDDYLISCFKYDNFNSENLVEILPFNFFYIVDFKTIKDKYGDLRNSVILRNSEDLDPFNSKYYNLDTKDEKYFELYEFIKEFNNIAYWYIPLNNYHNTLKLKNSKSLVKLFLDESSKFEFNIYKNIYLNSEINYGINYFTENKWIFNSLLSKDDSFKRCKINKEITQPIKIRLTIFNFNDDFFNQQYFEIIDNKYYKLNIYLKKGEYFILIENLLVDPNNLTIMTLNGNASSKFKFQTVTDDFYFNYSENKLWGNYITMNKLSNIKDNNLFNIDEKFIKYQKIELLDFEIVIFKFITNFDEPLKIKLKIENKENCHFENPEDQYFLVYLTDNKPSYYTLKIKNNELNFDFKFKFQGLYKINNDSKIYQVPNNLKKIRKEFNYINCYYFQDHVINNDCQCRVF